MSEDSGSFIEIVNSKTYLFLISVGLIIVTSYMCKNNRTKVRRFFYDFVIFEVIENAMNLSD
jgi:hypothetical protein